MYVDNRGVFAQSIRPMVDAGLADLIVDVCALAANVPVEFAAGHIVGQQMVSLTSVDHSAVFTSDAFRHPFQLLDPDNPFGAPEND
jgi:hypothetical protein